MLNSTLKKLQVSMFFFLIALTAFGSVSTGLLNLYTSSLVNFASFLWFFVGVSLSFGVFFLSKKVNYSSRLIYHHYLVFLSISLIILLIPFSYINYKQSHYILYVIYALYLGLGFFVSNSFQGLKYSINLKQAIGRYSYWFYAGIFIGGSTLFLLFFYSSIYFIPVPLVCMALSLFILQRSGIFYYIVVILTFILTSIVLYLYIIYQIFYIPYDMSVRRYSKDLKKQFVLLQSQKGDKSVIGVSEAFQGNLPYFEDIYLNGMHYGRFIQASNTDYINYTPYSVVYNLLPKEHKTLILNSRGSFLVYLAHLLKTKSINAVEENQLILDIIKNKASSYLGGIYHNQETLFYRSSVRAYVQSSEKKYDLIAVPYQIFSDSHERFHHLNASLFSYEAIQGYFKALYPKGLLYIQVDTPYNSLSEIITMNIIKTVKSYFPRSDLLTDHLEIFTSHHSINLLISKTTISEEWKQRYLDLLKEKGFDDGLSETYQYKSIIRAILDSNKNILSKLPYEINIIKDKNPYIFDLLSFHYPYLFKASLREHIFMMGVILLLLLILLVVKLTVTSYHRIITQVPFTHFIIYFLLMGFFTGLVFNLWKIFFMIMGSSPIDAALLNLALVGGLLGGGIIFRVRLFFIKTLLSLVLTLIILCFYFIGASSLAHYILSFSLLARILLSIVVFFPIFLFLLVFPITSHKWFELVIEEKEYSSYMLYFIGLVFGLIIGYLLALFFDVQLLFILSIFSIFVLIICFILIDREYKKHNFLHRNVKY